jgi:VanZ family protein
MSKFKYWLPAIFYVALIFYLSSRPAPDELRCIPIIAKLKVVHIIEYGILYLLACYSIVKTTTYSKLEVFALALMITVLYGLTDEFHQIFVVGRTARFADVIADVVGGILSQAGITISNYYRS